MSICTTVSTGRVFLPGAEFVNVKFTSGDTYKSKKFRKITGAVHGGIQNSTSTTDGITIYIGTSDVSTITIMSNTAATSLETSLILWGLR